MLYLLLLYLCISFICLLTGILIYEWRSSPARSPIVYTITGLIVLTGITQWLVLLLPLSGIVNTVIMALPIILSLYYRKRVWPKLLESWSTVKRLGYPGLFCFCCFVIMILTINAGPVKMDDTESYHIQMVKWLREYGTVPGLANLHLRYGFNSSWFSAVGLLTPPTEGINSYFALNGVLSCWFCLYLLEKLQQVYADVQNRMRWNIIVSLLLVTVAALFAWSMIRGNTTNMNYDFITTVCLFVLFLEVILAEKFRFEWEWIAWPCFLFTVRIINFPVLLLTLYVLIISLKNPRRSFGYGLLIFLLVAPFLTRNVMLSGYAFFPGYQLDIFPVDWKADRQMTVSILDYIKYFNRVNIMFKPLEETKALSFPGWIPEWFRFLFSSEKPVVVAGLAGFITGLAFYKRLRKQMNGAAAFFLGMMGVQLIAWFFIAPDPRFVFGPLLVGLFLPAIVLPPLNAIKNSRIIFIALLLLLSVAMLTYSARKIISSPQHKNLFLPFDIPKPETETVDVDGIRMHIPKKINNNWNPRCYDTQLPCVYRVHPGLRARGKQISDGFYIENPGTYDIKAGEWY